MSCPVCGQFMGTAGHICVSRPVQAAHPDWQYEIKISDDNTKGEKRVTVHVRSDGDPDTAVNLAKKIWVDTK